MTTTASLGMTTAARRLSALLVLAYAAGVAQLWIGGIARRSSAVSPQGGWGDLPPPFGTAGRAGPPPRDSWSRPQPRPPRRRRPDLPTCRPRLPVGPDGTPVPIRRIHFYHVRKAGGTMLREYLARVARLREVDLEIREYRHASATEEVGSRDDTFYVTNLRDPVERSISHFKYDGRWECERLSGGDFVPTLDNAMPFESWNDTRGFRPSPCDVPFSFTSCAVACYLQAFSGRGCTVDSWTSEYNDALDRLRRYNFVFDYGRFREPGYVRAVEGFFGADGFGRRADVYCGAEAQAANRRWPLRVGFESVMRLTRANAMDTRLYRDLTSSCGDGEGEEGAEAYAFPATDPSMWDSHADWAVTE